MTKKLIHDTGAFVENDDFSVDARPTWLENGLSLHCPEWAADGGSGFEWIGALDPWPPREIRRESRIVGRNDPCPCGSGATYKRCCLN